MTIIDTNKLEALEKRPGWRGHIFHSQTMTFAHWDFSKGATIHAHDHEQEEVWHIVEGELELTIGSKSHIAGPGMVAIVPPHAAHEVKALSDGMAIVADYPLRKDFR
jgi:quercetin dioxygenase-like cupin family protein